MIPSHITRLAPRAVLGEGEVMGRRAAWLLALGVLAACGARTGLLAPYEDDGLMPDGGVDGARPDGSDPLLRQDGGRDGGMVDADADARVPPIDAQPQRDASLRGCNDASTTVVYLISDERELVSFDPPTMTFSTVGQIRCPSGSGSSPFSMAVDREGTALVLYSNGELFRVSTANAACSRTSFVPGQRAFEKFGMGFSASPTNLDDDVLYLAAYTKEIANLGRVDSNLNVIPIGQLSPGAIQPELTGTGDGRLFAFYEKQGFDGSAIGQVDPTAATIVAESLLPGLRQGTGWAFAFWGGDFYLFTTPASRSIITRFRPNDNSITSLGAFPGRGKVVGAGVSTCAPQR